MLTVPTHSDLCRINDANLTLINWIHRFGVRDKRKLLQRLAGAEEQGHACLCRGSACAFPHTRWLIEVLEFRTAEDSAAKKRLVGTSRSIRQQIVYGAVDTGSLADVVWTFSSSRPTGACWSRRWQRLTALSWNGISGNSSILTDTVCEAEDGTRQSQTWPVPALDNRPAELLKWFFQTSLWMPAL